MKKQFLVIGFLATILAGCGAQYAFPTKLPDSKTINANYKAWKHQLAANPAYYFSLLIPNDWKILQTSIAKEPFGDKPLELGLFREPGAWMTDDKADPEGEIVAEVFTLSGSTISGGALDQAPMAWLKSRLKKGVGAFSIVKERTYTSAYGPAADLLATSGAGKAVIVSRLFAFHSLRNPQEIFVLTCSAKADGYAHVADAFLTAIGTFRLQNAKPVKTLTGTTIQAASSASAQTSATTSAVKIQVKY